MPKRAALKERKTKSSVTVCLLLSSSSLSQERISLDDFFENIISLPRALVFYFFSSTRTHMLPLITKPVGPCQWIMLGTSNSMVTMAFFPCCEPKWFQVELNNKSQILHVHGPWCKQPMSSVWLVKVSKLTSHYPVVHQCTMGYGIP